MREQWFSAGAEVDGPEWKSDISAKDSVQDAGPPREVAGLVSTKRQGPRLDELVLDEALEGRLRRIVKEHAAAEALAERGLLPRRKLLSLGPM